MRHLHAALARRGGDLAADPARADDDEPSAGVEHGAQRVGVLDGAQDVDAVEIGAGDRRAAGLRAGGEQQRVVGHALAAGEHDRAGADVERLDRRLGAQLDRVLLVPGRVLLQVDRVAVGLAAQVVLAQRRALVGALGLGAQQDDAAVESRVAQGLRGLAARHAGADDDECSRHECPLWS